MSAMFGVPKKAHSNALPDCLIQVVLYNGLGRTLAALGGCGASGATWRALPKEG